MDDDLLADDGQYKDDLLDDLDNETEAALLGISDEELEDGRSQNDDQELEFVDEDGNPVSIGENNADQYEVANIETNKLRNQPDEDVLELDDLDAELDSFQETSDVPRESPTPAKSYSNDRQNKENLISLTSRKEQERPLLRRKESRYSPEEDHNRLNKDVSFSNQGHSSRVERRDSYNEDLELDEESEDENIADDHRERFKSERSNIITLTPAKRRTDIPDTLESVISVEETAKVQAFLENEQKRKMRFKGKMQGRMKPSPRFQRPAQSFGATQVQQPPPQFSSSNAPAVSQPVSTAPQPRKILINPHFRGIRIPPPTEPVHSVNEPPQQQQPSVPPSSYDQSSYPPPPVQYSHQEPVHPASVAPPPIYTAPPPTVQYKQPEYPPPQQPVQQIPPHTWQQQPPPEMPVQSYSMPPPPVVNYGDPVPQQPNYNTYNQSYQNTSYQNLPVPMPQSVNYSQPPPPVHLYSQSYPTPPVNPVSSSLTHTQYSHTPSQMRMQTSVQSQQYQQPPVSSHMQKPRFSQNSQRLSRPPEKRMANTNIKHVPLKQPRLDHPPKKTNVHVNSSNIREIPLVDMLPTIKKPYTVNKTVPIVEEEDEKTRELRIKIEEQKLLREQVLKRKEERRRQMAAQRLMELKSRQADQNKNTVTIIPKAMNQMIKVQSVIPVNQPIAKPSVKERIGPVTKNAPVTKKKIVVVRKKTPQQNTVAATPPVNVVKADVTKPPAVVGQRIKLPISSTKPNSEQAAKTVVTTVAKQNISNKQVLNSKPVTSQPSKPVQPVKPAESKPQVNVTNQKNQPVIQPTKKVSAVSHAQKIKNLRLGNRPNFQRPQFPQFQRMHRPRIPGPRGAQFPNPPPFREPRMPFPTHGPPPMNDIRMPPHHFQEPRPPLLPFRHPHGEPRPYNNFFPPELPNSPPFRMRGPVPPNFRPRGMDPPMFHDRFPPPPPQYRNQMPQMRPPVMDNNMNRFQRPPRFQHQARPRFTPNNNINQKPINQPKTVQVKPSVPTPQVRAPNPNQKPNEPKAKDNVGKPVSKVVLTRNQPQSVSNDKDIPKTQSVSIANLSSSTNEAQLKKLCSSVGVVENIQLLKSERKAVIKFKEPRQALMFQKKYQRYMLDLAMIQVSLLPS